MIQKLKNVINMDGWVNALTGLGIMNRDKRVSATIAYSPMPEADAEFLYAGDDMAAKVVDLLPNEAFRESYKFTGEVDSDVIKDRLLALDADKAMEKAWRYARLYGGSAIFLVSSDSADLSQPMRPGAKILGLTVLTRWELFTQFSSIQNDLTKPNFGMPMLYRFQPRFYSIQNAEQIHASRLIRFDGVELPERQRISNQYWGDSVLNRTFAAIQAWNTVHDSAASIVQDFRTAVFKIKDLADKIADGNENLIVQRMKLIDLSRSIARAVVIDADGEEFDYKTSSLAGLKELLDKSDQRLVSSTRMPHTILLGESPQGSNATGNSTTTSWYDYVANQQKVYLKAKHKALAAAVSAGEGDELDDFDIEYEPLWQMDQKDVADIRLKVAQADAIYMDHQAVDPREIAISRFGTGEFSMDTTIDPSLRKASAAPAAPKPGAEDKRNQPGQDP